MRKNWIRHPLDLIPAWRLPAVFWPLLAATLVIMVVMNFAGAPLVNPVAPQGIVSYELAGSAARAADILQAWDATARQYAAFGLGLDYLFMLFYANTLALGCVWAALTLSQPGRSLARLGAPLAWGLWLAAVLDGVENVALFRQLTVAPQQSWAVVAYVCASVKFALIFLGLVYIFYALIVQLAAAARPTRRRPRSPV